MSQSEFNARIKEWERKGYGISHDSFSTAPPSTFIHGPNYELVPGTKIYIPGWISEAWTAFFELVDAGKIPQG